MALDSKSDAKTFTRMVSEEISERGSLCSCRETKGDGWAVARPGIELKKRYSPAIGTLVGTKILRVSQRMKHNLSLGT